MSNRMPMRIGNQTSFSALSPVQPYEYAVENGFDAFEWFPDKKESGAGWEESDLDTRARHHIRETALRHDIALSVHAPWMINPLESKAYERLLEDLEFAQDNGAILLNIHLYADEGIDAYIEAILPFIRRLVQADIRLSIENTPLNAPEEFNALFSGLQFLKPEEKRLVGMCLDIGHANLYEKTLNNYLRFIDKIELQVPIIHLHLHENYGDSDSHLPLFTGPAGNDDFGVQGLLMRLTERSFSGCIILEDWPQPPTLLNEARNRLREMIQKLSASVEPDEENTPGPIGPQDMGYGRRQTIE
jgi:sugar phosphate isomerase/epimerase